MENKDYLSIYYIDPIDAVVVFTFVNPESFVAVSRERFSRHRFFFKVEATTPDEPSTLPCGSVFSVPPCLSFFFSFIFILNFVRLLALFVIGWKDPCDLIFQTLKRITWRVSFMYFKAASLILSPARLKLLAQLSLHGSRICLPRASNRSARVRRRLGTKDLEIWEWNGTWLLHNPCTYPTFVVPTRRLYPLWFHRFHVSSMD